MLVIDGVELIALDQAHQVRELDRQHAFGLQDGRQPGDEIVELRDLCEDVIGDDEVGRFDLGCKSDGQPPSKELRQCRYAGRLSRRGYVLGRLYAEAWNAVRDKIPQEVSIVARDFDDEAMLI